MWIIGGMDNDYNGYRDVWSSRDGVTWTEATPSAAFSPRYFESSVVHRGKMWVIGGGDFGNFYNDVWNFD